jgi:hypothetical protein
MFILANFYAFPYDTSPLLNITVVQQHIVLLHMDKELKFRNKGLAM